MTPIGFYSAVADRQKKGFVLVRARAKADIWNLYRCYSTAYKKKRPSEFRCQMSRPKADEHRDYRWRIGMRKRDWARIVASLARSIDYCNFKDEVHKRPDQANKNSAYLTVWSALYRVQQGENPTYRPTAQRWFDWQEELDRGYAEDKWSRFDALEPEPIKTIRSVTIESHDHA